MSDIDPIPLAMSDMARLDTPAEVQLVLQPTVAGVVADAEVANQPTVAEAPAHAEVVNALPAAEVTFLQKKAPDDEESKSVIRHAAELLYGQGVTKLEVV